MKNFAIGNYKIITFLNSFLYLNFRKNYIILKIDVFKKM